MPVGYKGKATDFDDGGYPGDFTTVGERWSNRTHTQTPPKYAHVSMKMVLFDTHDTKEQWKTHVAQERKKEASWSLPFIPRNKKRRRESRHKELCCWVVVRRVSPFWDAALGAINAHTIFCLALANRFCLADGIANAVHADWKKSIIRKSTETRLEWDISWSKIDQQVPRTKTRTLASLLLFS